MTVSNLAFRFKPLSYPVSSAQPTAVRQWASEQQYHPPEGTIERLQMDNRKPRKKPMSERARRATSSASQLTCVEIFAGIGGLALGTASAGFKHLALVERDNFAMALLSKNQELGVQPIVDWPLCHEDVNDFDFEQFPGTVDLLSGGPPCQPYSQGGKGRGVSDKRDAFPLAITGVRKLRPKAFLFENVVGMTRGGLWEQFEYIKLQLEHLDLSSNDDESWKEHLHRLREHHISTRNPSDYRVVVQQVNAADFGVPQLRKRLMFVGLREDQDLELNLPKATHSQEVLEYQQLVTGEYWERHGLKSRALPANHPYLAKFEIDQFQRVAHSTKPYLTIRDAVHDLPRPARSAISAKISGHFQIPGAKSYPGHVGSQIDRVAKTIKAGAHGVPGGENTLQTRDGVRYLTLRELARLQTIPDAYFLDADPWTRTMAALGNAVPVSLARTVSGSIRRALEGS